MPALAAFRQRASAGWRAWARRAASPSTTISPTTRPPSRTTLDGLRARVGGARILVAMEPRSNSMRLGAHADATGAVAATTPMRWCSCSAPNCRGTPARVTGALAGRGETAPDVATLVSRLADLARPGDHVVFMSNGGFENAPRLFVVQAEAASHGAPSPPPMEPS